ncbi:hypothetical protein D9M72_440690 [compost metagenome]
MPGHQHVLPDGILQFGPAIVRTGSVPPGNELAGNIEGLLDVMCLERRNKESLRRDAVERVLLGEADKGLANRHDACSDIVRQRFGSNAANNEVRASKDLLAHPLVD